MTHKLSLNHKIIGQLLGHGWPDRCDKAPSIPEVLCIILTESLVFKCNTKSAIEICNDVPNILNTHRNLEIHDKYLRQMRAINDLRESGQE